MRESIDNAVPSPRPDPAAMHVAEQAFRQTYPTFDSTSSLDELRAREYARLDLSRWHPDFVPLSFYKLFGYPTGVGCLLARKSTLAKLQRPWFSGGTVWGISVQGDGRPARRRRSV